MVNVGRVIGSTRLGCQHILVIRPISAWVNGQYKPIEIEDLVCLKPSNFEDPHKAISGVDPADFGQTEVISGVTNTFVVDAIATNTKAKSIDMSPEGNRLTGGMNFLTTRELMPNDIVEWRGARFKIMQVTPNIDYGYYRSSGERLNGEGIG